MKTYLLICEGPCNPSLRAYDASVAKWRYPDPALKAMLRHTPHVHACAERYQCQVCGTERQYGK